MPLPAVLGIPLLIGGILSGAASVDALFGSRVWNLMTTGKFESNYDRELRKYNEENPLNC